VNFLIAASSILLANRLVQCRLQFLEAHNLLEEVVSGFGFHHTEVRILPPQPGSLAFAETTPATSRKAYNCRAFATLWTVSRLPNSPNPRPICRKSPAAAANIPVFGRLTPETGFDPHCVVGAQSNLALDGCRPQHKGVETLIGTPFPRNGRVMRPAAQPELGERR
jgi:hypothetical protein